MITAHVKYAKPVPVAGDSPAQAVSRLTKLLGNSNGVDIINNTTAYTGKWCRIDVLATAAFTSLAGTDVTLKGTFNITATVGGPPIVGEFTNIKLASGCVAAYRMDKTATA